jgi:hypothetical protein
MQIERLLHGSFVQLFSESEHMSVEKVFVDGETSSITIYNKDGTKSSIIHRDGDDDVGVYQRQYGLSLSADGQALYIQSWERGLYAYDVRSGKRLWRTKLARVLRVAVLENSLVCTISGKGLRRLNPATGEVVEKHLCGEAKVVFLPNKQAFYGPYRQRWKLIALDNFSTLAEYADRDINVHQSLSFVVSEVQIESNHLKLLGFQSNGASAYEEPEPFVRVIPLTV